MNSDEITVEIAELAGFFAADGSMQKEHLCFWGNPKSDKDYYDRYLPKLFSKAFGISINPHEKPSNSVYGFYICNKKIIEFFNKKLGFPIGKKTYSVEIPDIIYRDKNLVRAFIRGFFAGDGCLNFDKRYSQDQKILRVIHTYPRIQIKCVSKNLIYQMSNFLNNLEIINFISKKQSRKRNEAESYMLQVSGKIMLDRWVDEIGLSNDNHRTRYEIFKKHGFVPSNTTYKERLKILEGKLNPWSFYPKWACSLAWIGRQGKS